MHKFDYHRPQDVKAAEELRRSKSDAVYLAGGQTLLPTLKQRLASPSDVIDLGKIALAGIEVTKDKVSIGAMTRHAQVADSADVRSAIPALAHLANEIGDAQVRNRGTIGGSLANSDPAADYPAAVVGLGATIVTSRRSIAADDYFKDLFTTALQGGELIVKVEFPIPKRAAYCKFPNPASRYAVVGVMVAETAPGVGTGGSIRVGITGAGPCAFRATALEAALTKRLAPDAVDAVTIDASRLNSDMHASAEYRANLVKVLAKRAVAQLLGV
jgi:carbon-monoxide dehydrogenase medium subunit